MDKRVWREKLVRIPQSPIIPNDSPIAKFVNKNAPTSAKTACVPLFICSPQKEDSLSLYNGQSQGAVLVWLLMKSVITIATFLICFAADARPPGGGVESQVFNSNIHKVVL